MADIAILGSGRVATGLAKGLTHAGRSIAIGSRDPASAREKWDGPAIMFGAVAQVVTAADIIINATPGDTSVERLSALSTELAGKILVDVANATGRGDNGMPLGLIYPSTSLGEELQKALPETHVVKTLNTMLFTVMTNPGTLKSPATAFLSGDDAEAKKQVALLLADLGWASEQIEDLGGIVTARGTEPLIQLIPAIIGKHGFAPFAFSLSR